MSGKPKTHRVRIAVTIDENGSWVCYGGGSRGKNLGDEELRNVYDFADEIEDPNVLHFIEADVPLPESVTVEGRVKK